MFKISDNKIIEKLSEYNYSCYLAADRSWEMETIQMTLLTETLPKIKDGKEPTLQGVLVRFLLPYMGITVLNRLRVLPEIACFQHTGTTLNNQLNIFTKRFSHDLRHY